MKPTIEYVISAPLLGVFPNQTIEKVPHRDLIKETINAYSAILYKSTQAKIRNYDSKISILYNGFTEENQLRNFNFYGRLKFDNLYSDSGGLQMVTRQMTITDELKDKVYEVQRHADYAMCFDVIKLGIEGSKERTKNERSNVSNKTFHGDEHRQAGIDTGKNVKRQIQYFRDKGVNTKVILIVQGNTVDDMLMFFNEIEKQLAPEDYAHIGGFAVADTCMGNSEIESVDMLRAAHEISQNCHPNIAQHLHLLGIGSLHRMLPVVYLKQSGYLNKINYISYDSSTHAQSFAFGTVRINGTTMRLGAHHNETSYNHFQNLYNYFSDFLKQHITAEEFNHIVFGTEHNVGFGDVNTGWSIAKINERNIQQKNPWHIAIGYLLKTAHTFYQVDNFVNCIDKVWDDRLILDKKNLAMILALRNVKTSDDMLDWLRHQKQTKKTKSKRIKRKENQTTLEGFM